MKKLILTLAIAALGLTAYAQDEFAMDIFYPPQVPAEVQAKFEQLYPGMDDVSWEVEDGNYEAEFEVNDMDHEVIFDPMGKVLYSEKEICPGELPARVSSYIGEAYPGKKISGAMLITDETGKVIYEAEVKRDDLLFDANGTLIDDI